MDGTNSYSLADIAAASGDGGFGGNSSWVLIILFALIFGGGAFGGFGGNNSTAATANDIQRAVDLNSIQEGQAGISADIQRGIYEINGSTKDAAYNNLGEIRDVQAAVSTGNANIINSLTALQANMQSCCCETKQLVMENRYLAAQNTAEINANTTAQVQKVLDKMASDRISALEQEISKLNLAAAVSGTVKYPMSTTYTAGLPMFANSCNCNGNV